jgi:RsiW-degrading membrane proteinase PrsW (M82 family)
MGCFIGGGVIVALVLPIQQLALSINSDTVLYTVLAGIEEILKFGVAFFIAFKSKDMDEPIDVMIYMITVALGFSAVENTLYSLKALGESGLTVALINTNLRFVGASLVHVVSSSVIGLCLALVFYKKLSTKIIFTFVGLILSIVLHTSFNLAIINTTALSTLKVFAWVWCAVVILIILFEEIKAIKPSPVKSPF